MEWVYDNQQNEKEIFNAYLDRFTCLKASTFVQNRLSYKEELIVIDRY